MTEKWTGKYVVVTTDTNHRGVFFGILVSHNTRTKECVLKDFHHAVKWSEGTKGFSGLASIGPQEGSRISPPAPSIYLEGVSSVLVASEAAILQWQKMPWG